MFIRLIVEMPHMESEAAYMTQQFLYALIDAFDDRYCSEIERYHKNKNQNSKINAPAVNEFDTSQDPF